MLRNVLVLRALISANASVHYIKLLLGDERSAQTWVDANVELGLMLQYRPQHSERSFRAAMKRC
jgi:hypothetical protein